MITVGLEGLTDVIVKNPILIGLRKGEEESFEEGGVCEKAIVT